MATSLVRRSLSNRYLVNTAMTVVYGPQFRPRYRFEQVINRGNTNDCFRGKERHNYNSSHDQNVGNIAVGVALGVGALCIWSIKEHIKKFRADCHHGDAKSSTADSDKPRTGYLDWDNYFMGVAFLSAKRSKDPKTQVGACIINNDDRIVGVGYNGMPNGCKDSELPWGKGAGIEDSKSFYVCHAELNAVLNKNAATLKGCKIYVSLFPCNECAKLIIQSGISEVIYYSDKHSEKEKTKASRKMLQMAGVTCRRFFPKKSEILIDFTSINTDVQQQHNKERQGAAATPPCMAQGGTK